MKCSDGLEHLLHPRTDRRDSRRFEGTGLGLAMVKLFTELHGGTVAVDSTESEGSSFTVWLPCRELDGEESVALRPTISPRLNRMEGGRTALVVEDDYKSADLIRVQLEAEGFEVLHAASAEAALCSRCRPWSLLHSTHLPNGMAGSYSELKQVQTQAHTFVIVSIVADPSKDSHSAAAVMQTPV